MSTTPMRVRDLLTTPHRASLITSIIKVVMATEAAHFESAVGLAQWLTERTDEELETQRQWLLFNYPATCKTHHLE